MPVTTVLVPRGQILNITTDALTTGLVTRLSNSTGGDPQSTTQLTANADLSFGVYAETERFSISHVGGGMNYTIQNADLATEDQATGGSGWAFYDDSTLTSGSPLTIANTRSQITIDGLGSSTDKTQLPADVTDFWLGNEITPENAGDAYELRIDFKASVNAVNSYCLLQLDIGDETPINIVNRTITFPRGQNIVHDISVGFGIFSGSTFLANGGKLFIDTSSAGDTVTLYEPGILIARVHQANGG